MNKNKKEQILRSFRIGFVALLGGGVVANLFREGLTVDAAVTGLGIGIAAVVSTAMIVVVVLLILVIADRWSARVA